MDESLAFSLSLDLMFNGQDLDYCERPIVLDQIDTITTGMQLPENAKIGVIGPGGGRLVKGLLERGYEVEAFEGRAECFDHMYNTLGTHPRLKLDSDKHLTDPIRIERLSFDALICLDDLRSFREQQEWTSRIQMMVKSKGYFLYSQVSNKLPKQKNNLPDHFDLIENVNVTKQTSEQIRKAYFNLNEWQPADDAISLAKKTLDIVEQSHKLRRSIRDGVTIRYLVWRKKQ
ncbi:hypothetical protein QGN29_11235 [Temperatibacter marinus]|uniref:Uncharacterized protein n=1 Tax=Temperatibacter marinus TaxID=1456591 RepID=A0AA52H943_9PROT|nr:hypothetical protein [Temperatibacter marinus]WND02122.1 hypothetical protein QGN29_11235 [Temperatibacter marinus]